MTTEAEKPKRALKAKQIAIRLRPDEKRDWEAYIDANWPGEDVSGIMLRLAWWSRDRIRVPHELYMPPPNGISGANASPDPPRGRAGTGQ